MFHCRPQMQTRVPLGKCLTESKAQVLICKLEYKLNYIIKVELVTNQHNWFNIVYLDTMLLHEYNPCKHAGTGQESEGKLRCQGFMRSGVNFQDFFFLTYWHCFKRIWNNPCIAKVKLFTHILIINFAAANSNGMAIYNGPCPVSNLSQNFHFPALERKEGLVRHGLNVWRLMSITVA